MPFTHTVENRLLHFRWHGVISRKDLQTFGRNMPGLVASLGFSPNILHTFDGMKGHSFQPLMVYMFSLLRKRAQIPAPVKSAAVAKTPKVRAIARLFKACNHSPNLTIEVFESEEAARAWLALEKELGPERALVGSDLP